MDTTAIVDDAVEQLLRESDDPLLATLVATTTPGTAQAVTILGRVAAAGGPPPRPGSPLWAFATDTAVDPAWRDLHPVEVGSLWEELVVRAALAGAGVPLTGRAALDLLLEGLG